jgi:spore coat polysaccharide biosynthesis predicted glycosyltransferase SpsG
LAEEAISRGVECIFIGEISGLAWVSERIAKLGFSQLIEDVYSFKVDPQSDVLVLDTYSIPVSDPFISKHNWKLVLTIRDAFTPKYESDIEVRPGLLEVHSENQELIILSGPDNQLIRQGIGKSNKEYSDGEVLKVLTVGGGSDPFGFVPALALTLSSIDMELEVHAFTNEQMPEDSKVRFVRNTIGTNLDLIANQVDVVFTTASTSSLEFIAKEIPTGVACAVDNQTEFYDQLGRLGYAYQIGVLDSDQTWDFNLPLIKELLESQEKRNSLKEATRGLIDLKGAVRVIDVLLSLC